MNELSQAVLVTMGAIFAVLIASSVLVAVLRRAKPGSDFRELRDRVNSWWVIAGVFLLAVALSERAALVFLAFVCFLAFKEYLSLIPTRRADRRVLLLAYVAIPVQFWWIATGWYAMAILFVPVYVFLAIPTAMALVGETKGYLRAASTIHWGLMTTVFSLSHTALLLTLPEHVNEPSGGAGLLLFLVLLTQANDVMQYVWGKAFGRIRVAPRVSPGKTLGGLAGGVATTTLIAWLLAPHLTPLRGSQALLAGVIVGAAGFLGDIAMSALKRDLGVKDSGSLIPGHGGVLDRVDSLTFTAPLFFHYLFYVAY